MNVLPYALTAMLLAQATPAATPGDVAFSKGNFDAAYAAYAMQAAAAPNDEDAMLGLGTLELYRGDLSDARVHLMKAAQLDPRDERPAMRLRALHEMTQRPGDFSIAMQRDEIQVPFVTTDPLPMIAAKINGHNVRFVIDTGAPALDLSATLIKRLGIPMHAAGQATFAGGKTAPIFAGRADTVDFPGVRVSGVPIGQIPPEMPMTMGGRTYDGILGTTFLRQFLATIDYRHGNLILRPRSTSARFEADVRSHGGSIAAMWLVPDHMIFVRARVGTHDGLFNIDTGGEGVGIDLSSRSLQEAKISADTAHARQFLGGGGAVRVVPFIAPSIAIGTYEQHNVPGITSPEDPHFPFAVAGRISHAFFRGAVVTFDFSAMRLIIE
ncbi:MAG: aspartyl protease family protein [Candidatus Eremiobacteraeota bacterium]|nr:aspartyl protease family protein [Candidatus Eremiobacteraeota bacterium]